MRIALIGAFDRYNYGDVLFPLIVEKALEQRIENCEFDYFAYKQTDLTQYNAKKTKHFNEMKSFNPDAIIIVGGEVLTSSWSLTLLFQLDDHKFANGLKLLKKVFGSKIADYISMKKLDTTHRFPWVIPQKLFPGTKIIYNTVGGAGDLNTMSHNQEYFKQTLNESSFISVRESLSKVNLEKMGVNNIHEYPDSAIIMSNYYPLDELKNLVSNQDFLIKEDYVVYQMGAKYEEGNTKLIAEELLKIKDKFNKRIVLLPIGLAALHEDDIPLTKIKHHLNEIDESDDSVLIADNTIFDTMSIIAHSDLFLGTSLHGNITALSYSRPSIGMNKKVVKLSEFLNKYSIPNQLFGVEYTDLSSKAEIALNNDKNLLIDNAHRLKSLVNENFDLMAEKIVEQDK